LTRFPVRKAEFRALQGVADDHYSEMVGGQAEASKSDVDLPARLDAALDGRAP
jgi:hypothetical protein